MELYKDPSELHCSPKAHKFAEKNSTCYSHGELRLLAKEFNKKSPKKITGKSKQDLVKQLLEAYKDICDKHQFCWIKHTLTDPQKISKLEKAFRPKKPASWNVDRNTWLNTYDILYVMKQYEELYKDFAFLGVYPIDFASEDDFGYCVGEMMCDFHIKKNILDKGKKRFGIVFNTDPSTRGGEHWIALYCNLNKKRTNYGVYFYDSVGSKAPREVKNLMSKIVEQVNDPKFESLENKIQKQFDNYDCGVYACVFLTQCLKNIKFREICERMKNDAGVNKLRDILYRPNK